MSVFITQKCGKDERKYGNWRRISDVPCVSLGWPRCLPKGDKKGESEVPRQSWKKASYQAACQSGFTWRWMGLWYLVQTKITGRRKQYQPAENLVRRDYIVAWNDEKIENKKNCSEIIRTGRRSGGADAAKRAAGADAAVKPRRNRNQTNISWESG